MNKGAGLTIGVIAVAVAAGSGYWLGGRGGASHGDAAQVASAPAEPAKKEKKLLFYRNPMGLPDTSPVPKKDPMGICLLYTSPSPRDRTRSRMPSSA